MSDLAREAMGQQPALEAPWSRDRCLYPVNCRFSSCQVPG